MTKKELLTDMKQRADGMWAKDVNDEDWPKYAILLADRVKSYLALLAGEGNPG